jgi:hypothetical protein
LPTTENISRKRQGASGEKVERIPIKNLAGKISGVIVGEALSRALLGLWLTN